MARIPNEEIERIKTEIDLKSLIESYGVKLEPKGKDWSGLCPNHDDHEPSLVVTPEKNLWHCLGACQTGGDAIEWVKKVENVSFRHAVEILKGKCGEKPPGEEKGGSAIGVPAPADGKPFEHRPEPVDQTGSFYHKTLDITGETTRQTLLNLVIDYYHYSLKENPPALQYLERRKLIHPELLDHFKLGFANRTLCYRLPQGYNNNQTRSALQEIGILRRSGHEHFNGSLVIPVFDEQGQATEVYGRKVDRVRTGAPAHLYLKGQHKGVFNIQSFQSSKEIILCEALIDALTFWCHGFRNVTASYGVNGFTDDHLAAFKKYQIEHILIAYDNDEAGNSAADKLARKLTADGFTCSRIEFPQGMDANEFAQRSSDPEKDFQQLIISAPRIGQTEGAPAPSALPVSFLDSLSAPTEETCKMKDVSCKTSEGELVSGSSHLTSHPSHLTIPTEIKKEELIITLGDRKWRIRGLSKNLSYEQLKVNILVSLKEKFFVDSMDLYSSRLRGIFIKQAAAELEINEDIVKNDLGKVFLQLEQLQDEQIKKTLEPKKPEVVLTESEKQEALAFLQDPNLLARILSDFEKCGVVGEETNKLVGYLAAVSRKLDDPLAIIIQSSSAAGKTWQMESILAFVPEEEKVKYSAMTGQSLFYLGDIDIKYKILAIAEEEGVQKASYALKLLQSEGKLSIASTGKDPSTGRLVTQEYKVEGPVMIFCTTTNIDIDEELQNRCIILTVDESREQTRAIHKQQREKRTLEGLRAKREKTKILQLHRNAQRLLRSLPVVNPYARYLTFLDDKTRTRRDHEKYLSLIESVTLLHQYQRSVGKGNDESNPSRHLLVTLDDIEIANRLADEVLGRSLDELTPQTRKLLLIIEEMVEKTCLKSNIEPGSFRFSRRQVREYSGWGNTQLKVHLSRLEDMEYLLIHRGRTVQSFEYELLYDGKGKDGKKFMMGLIDVKKLRIKYDANRSGLKVNRPGPGRPLVGPRSGGGRGDVLAPLAAAEKSLEQLKEKNSKKTHIRVPTINQSSYRTLPAFDLSLTYALLAAKEKEFDQYQAEREAKQQAACVEPLTIHQPLTTNHAASGGPGNGDGRE